MLKWCFSEKCKTLVEVASADDASATKEQRHEAGACLLSPKAQRTRRHKTELATALENKRKHLWGTGKTRRASLNFLGWEVCLFIHPPSTCLLFWDRSTISFPCFWLPWGHKVLFLFLGASLKLIVPILRCYINSSSKQTFDLLISGHSMCYMGLAHVKKPLFIFLLLIWKSHLKGPSWST